MQHLPKMATAALLAATLAACSPGISGIGQRITFDASGMVVHASGQPDAHVSRDGDLSIDGKPVAVTPSQRQLLKQYYAQASGVMDTGKAMGKQGVHMAAQGIDTAIHSIFHGDSGAAEKQMDAESQKMEAAGNAMCGELKALAATQASIAAQVPAFAPYARDNSMRCTVTRSVTYSGNGATSTSMSYSLNTGSHATTGRVSAASAGGGTAAPSTATTASQP